MTSAAEAAQAELKAICAFHQKRLDQRMAYTVAWLPFRRKYGRWPDAEPQPWQKRMIRALTPGPERLGFKPGTAREVRGLGTVIDETGPVPAS